MTTDHNSNSEIICQDCLKIPKVRYKCYEEDEVVYKCYECAFDGEGYG